MALPWPLRWLVDPAGAYLERRAPRPRGPVFRRAAVFGLDVPRGSRQATDEEIAALNAVSRSARQEEAADDPVPSAVQGAAAEQLVRGSSASLRAGGRSVEARVVRFWRGDSVLEIATTGPDRHGTSRIRVPRQPDPDLLAGYLAMELEDG